MAGIYTEAEFIRQLGCLGDGLKFLVLFFGTLRVGVATRVQFDIGCPDFMGRFDLIQAWFHEQTGRDAAIPQQIDDFLNAVTVIDDIEPTFGGRTLVVVRAPR